jgi:DNA-binding transcriptional regulator LsrR (DeoR family)
MKSRSSRRPATREEDGPRRGMALLLDVAHLFYVEKRSQKEIGLLRNIHPSRVSRLVAEARKRNLVHFTLCPPTDCILAQHLQEHLSRTSVRHVTVGPAGRSQVATVAARYFEQDVGRSGMTLALDGGFTLSSFVDALRPGRYERVTIVPIAADPPSYAASAYELMTRLSVKYPIGVSCQKPPLHMDPLLQAERRKVWAAAAKADAVMLAAGPLHTNPTALEFMRHLGLDPKRIQSGYREVEGFCGYHAVDAAGRLVRIGELEEKMPRTLQFEQLLRLSSGTKCRTILVAATPQKAKAVLSVIRAGMCNTLVVDSDLAAALLRMKI